jgi:hypothetical protein
MKKWLYESGEVCKTFDTEEQAQEWFKKNDPEGVAFLVDVSELRPAGSADQYGVPLAEE